MPCASFVVQSSTGRREENVTRRRSQEKEMPTDKDTKRKRCQWKAVEKPLLSRDSDDIRKNMFQVSSFTAVNKKDCQDSEMTRADRIRKGCREKELSRTKSSKRSCSQWPWRPVRQASFLRALPVLFSLPPSKLPSAGLPGLYWYVVLIGSKNWWKMNLMRLGSWLHSKTRHSFNYRSTHWMS